MINFTADIGAMLAQVGIVDAGGTFDLFPGASARVFDSEYARLYIVDCADNGPVDWADVVRRADREVLRELRSKEFSGGGVVDAHVCFVVTDDAVPMAWAMKNEQLVRQVSRKYWIKSSGLKEELLSRLTILPVASTAPLQQAGGFNLASESLTWLDELIVEGAASSFGRFISGLETTK